MLIDWFTVLAQLINFIVLVLLLKKVLYKPILKVIADRQNKIAKQIRDAETKKKQAEEEYLLFLHKNEEFDQQKADKIKKLNDDIKQLQVQLKEEAKQNIEEQRTKWVSSLANEKDEVFRDLNQRMQTELFSIIRKIMTDLANADIQEQILDGFLRRLHSLSQEEKAKLQTELHATPTLQVRCAIDATETIRNKIKAGVQQEFNREFDIHFVVIPELIGGIELIANGEKISWNIADYLSSLERLITEVVNKNA